MTGERCNNLHPKYFAPCDSPVGNHPECSAWVDDNHYEDWPNPDYVPPKRVSGAREKVRELAGRVESAPTTAGFSAGLEASKTSAGRWTDEQRQLVDDAIRAVAERQDEFNADDVWEQLAGQVPVTKGMTSRLIRALSLAIIGNTDKTATSERGGQHDHGQRLVIWKSLIRQRT